MNPAAETRGQYIERLRGMSRPELEAEYGKPSGAADSLLRCWCVARRYGTAKADPADLPRSGADPRPRPRVVEKPRPRAAGGPAAPPLPSASPPEASLAAEHLGEVARAINEVVDYYARRARWYDARDLSQRAWVVALETLAKPAEAGGWDPARGPLVPYLARALRRQLGNEVIHDRAPVSTSRSNVCALYGVPSGAELSPATGAAPSGRVLGDPAATPPAPEPSAEPTDWTDAVLADRDWTERVLVRLHEVVGEAGRDGLVDLLREEPLPARSGRPSDQLTRSRARAVIAIAQDPALRAMLAERCS